MMASQVSLQNSEFNTFLFAPIGEDRNGMLLSVLSALARMDVDPWREAETLDRMPIARATQRLTALIDTLPDMAASPLDPGGTANRLIALLPGRTGSPVFKSALLSGIEPRPTLGLPLAWLLIAFVLGALFVLLVR